MERSFPLKGSKILVIDTTDYKYGACTGRVVEHWHTGSMTTRVSELARAVPGAYVELSESLAKKLGIKQNDAVSRKYGPYASPIYIKGGELRCDEIDCPLSVYFENSEQWIEGTDDSDAWDIVMIWYE